MSPPLAASLTMLARVMADAREPWWIIGSAAVILHGADTEASDIDVLLGVAGANDLDVRLGLGLRGGRGSALFRSERYGRWSEPLLPVEFMAGLAVRGGATLVPRTRVPIAVGDAVVHVPDRREMIAILELFGRPKDRARADLLRARPS